MPVGILGYEAHLVEQRLLDRQEVTNAREHACLLYTSDAADE